MNAINRWELFVLDDNEKPVEVEEDTKIPNAATIKVVKQDHTLANLLRSQLLSMPTVLFAGYKVPHPLQPYFLLKVQTDGSLTPAAALEQAANTLIAQLSSLQEKFKREFTFKDVEPGEGGDNAYGAVNGGLGGGMGAYGQDSAWAARDYLDL